MRRRVPQALALAALLGATGLAGCLGDPTFQLAASAPKAGGGLTILVLAQDFDSGTQALYEIRKDGDVVYPTGGFLSKSGFFRLAGEKGETFVPYDWFVVGNGNYEVAVDLDGTVKSTFVDVEKWVEYVYMYAYEKNGRIVVDVQLSRQLGGHAADRIIAEGKLTLEIWYHGLDGEAENPERVKVVHDETRGDRTFTRLSFPKSTFDRGPGWYSFSATFHNGQARGNANVGDDPTMDKTTPPRNWVCIDACA